VSLAVLAVLGACASDAGAIAGSRPLDRAAITTMATTTEPPTTTTASTAPTTTATEPAPATRDVLAQAWVPYAIAGPVTLHHPADRVEAIGFHQSGHDGAQHQTAVASAARWFVEEDRGRDTDPQGAADIVVEPGRALRVPVTGTVIRAGSYTLYCDHIDEYAVIEPDARPGWEVKVLHIEGLQVTKGQHVQAGVTPLAAHARTLPFPSAVNDGTSLPAWPHVHIEVVDPTVQDRPTGPGCP